MLILGIDPGSRSTGFGLIDNQPSKMTYVDSGFIKSEEKELALRIGFIFEQLQTLIRQYHPEQMSIEKVFMHKNADSALKLGQARGAALCAAHQGGVKVYEYAPREIKLTVVGQGAAEKVQVNHMVGRLLSIRKKLQADESDALAIAVCHAQHLALQQKTGIQAALFKRRPGGRR